MRLLLDSNLSPHVARLLRAEGFDAVHLRELDMQREADQVVLQVAVDERRILVSEDTDFGALLARSGATMPSCVLLRSGDPLCPDDHARLLGRNLIHLEADWTLARSS